MLTAVSEKEQTTIGLKIHNVSISPSPNTHVFAVLDTVSEADAKGLKNGLFGRDVEVWGGNCELTSRIPKLTTVDYQLGNGKKSAVATPQRLPALIPHAIDDIIAKSPELEVGAPFGIVLTAVIPHAPYKVGTAPRRQGPRVRPAREASQARPQDRGGSACRLELFCSVPQDCGLGCAILQYAGYSRKQHSDNSLMLQREHERTLIL